MNFTLADRQAILHLLHLHGQHKGEDLTGYALTGINGKSELLSAEELREAKQKCFNRNVKVKVKFV